MTDIAIKGMVCRHCVEAVEAIFHGLGVGAEQIEVKLGEASLADSVKVDADFLAALDREFAAHGFSRILDPGQRLVEAAKQVIIDHVRNHDCRFNLSACLQDHLNTDYGTLSKIFSATEGRTIEKYSIAQRVEFAKELLSYGGDDDFRGGRPRGLLQRGASVAPVQDTDRHDSIAVPETAPGTDTFK